MNPNEPLPHRALSSIDLEELADTRSNEEGGYYDPADGEVYPVEMGEVITGDDDESDPDERDWIRIDGEDSRDGYIDMEDFATGVSDSVLSDRLLRALNGRGAFRRFRDTVAEEGDDFREIWFRYSNGCRQARAIRWLVSEDLCDPDEAATALEELAVIVDRSLGEARQWTRQRS